MRAVFRKLFSAHRLICPSGRLCKATGSVGGVRCSRAEASSWAKIPKPVLSPYMVIADECHSHAADIKKPANEGHIKAHASAVCTHLYSGPATLMRPTSENIFFQSCKQSVIHWARIRKDLRNAFATPIATASNGREFWDGAAGRISMN